mmetsp:Transcript_349/g.1195  ORF Transcript_349/g.1195 Transcript_349/m.1195 type:complete len:505 (-) Transcript_349:3609-5123(-)
MCNLRLGCEPAPAYSKSKTMAACPTSGGAASPGAFPAKRRPLPCHEGKNIEDRNGSARACPLPRGSARGGSDATSGPVAWFTRRVPCLDPSLEKATLSSCPEPAGSLAMNHNCSLAPVPRDDPQFPPGHGAQAESCEGSEPTEPGTKSATIHVPVAVPSVRHSSRPATPSFAEKNTMPAPPLLGAATTVKSRGSEEPGPVRRSATRRVPAAVPSLAHSSRPTTPSSAENSASGVADPVLATTTSCGLEPPGPGRMSLTGAAAAAIAHDCRMPSVGSATPLADAWYSGAASARIAAASAVTLSRHNSRPRPRSDAEKSSKPVPDSAGAAVGSHATQAGPLPSDAATARFVTGRVPSGVPSVAHSSRPPPGLDAERPALAAPVVSPAKNSGTRSAPLPPPATKGRAAALPQVSAGGVQAPGPIGAASVETIHCGSSPEAAGATRMVPSAVPSVTHRARPAAGMHCSRPDAQAPGAELGSPPLSDGACHAAASDASEAAEAPTMDPR